MVFRGWIGVIHEERGFGKRKGVNVREEWVWECTMALYRLVRQCREKGKARRYRYINNE
jgi:hypothetical protein